MEANNTKSFIRESIIIFIIYSSTYPIGYLIRFLFAKNLSVEDFGLFYSVMAFINFFIIFRDLGLSESILRYIPKYKVEKRLDKIKGSIIFVLIFQFIIAVIIASGLAISSGNLAESFFKRPIASQMILLFAFIFIINGFIEVLNLSLMGLGKPRFKAISDFLHSFLMLGFSFIIFFFLKGALAPSISFSVTRIILFILLLFFFFRSFNFFKYKAHIDVKMIKTFFSYSFKLLIGTGAEIILSTFIVNMLTYFSGVEHVGIYGVAYPTASLLIIFAKPVGLVISPFSSEQWARKRKDKISEILNLSFSYLIIIVIPFLFIFFSYSDFIIGIVFGDQFLEKTIEIFGNIFTLAGLSLKIIVFGTLFSMFGSINSAVIAGIGKPLEVTKGVYVSAIVNIIFSVLLIPKLGIIGASISFLTSIFAHFLITLYYVNKFVGINFPILNWIKSFLAGIFFLLIISLLKNYLDLNIFIEIAVVLSLSAIVYIALVFLFGLIKINEINYFIRLGKKMLNKKKGT